MSDIHMCAGLFLFSAPVGCCSSGRNQWDVLILHECDPAEVVLRHGNRRKKEEES